MKRYYGLVAVALVGTSTPAPRAIADGNTLVAALEKCALGLVPSELRTTHADDLQAIHRDAMCGEWYSRHRDVIDAKASANVIVEAIPMGGKANYGRNTETISRTEYCQANSRNITTSASDGLWSRLVSDDARRTWLECVRIVSGALSATPSPVTVSVSKTYAISVRYNANFIGARPTLTSIEPTNLVCNIPKNLIGKKIPSEGNGFALQCSWVDGDATIASVLVRTSRGDVVETVERVVPSIAMVKLDVFRDDTTSKVDQIPRCSDDVFTVDMHNWKYPHSDGRCSHSTSDGKWCKGEYTVTVTPKGGGKIPRHTLRFNCDTSTDHRRDSCAWNVLEHEHHHDTTGDDSAGWTVKFRAGSRGTKIKVCGQETIAKSEIVAVSVPEAAQSWDVANGTGFVVTIPKGQRGVLTRIIAGKQIDAVAAGTESPNIAIISRVDTGVDVRYSCIYRK